VGGGKHIAYKTEPFRKERGRDIQFPRTKKTVTVKCAGAICVQTGTSKEEQRDAPGKRE